MDRNIHGTGILFYVREDIPTKLLSVESLPTECFFVEINLRKRKWLVCCSYNPHKDNINHHLQTISKKYIYIHRTIKVQFLQEILILRCLTNTCFFESSNLSSLVRELTCYKNLENPSCIDLFLTNFNNSFQNCFLLPLIIKKNHSSKKRIVWPS